jgi:hypothetical protein
MRLVKLGKLTVRLLYAHITPHPHPRRVERALRLKSRVLCAVCVVCRARVR